MENKYRIEGMTCESCVQKITQKLSEISGAKSVTVLLETKIAVINSTEKISIESVRSALHDFPKYKVFEVGNTPETSNKSSIKSTIKTYKPLILIFLYIISVSVSYQLSLKNFNLDLNALDDVGRPAMSFNAS